MLAEIEVNGRFDRDPDLYFLTVFGDPSLDSNWALRYEGITWPIIGLLLVELELRVHHNFWF